MRVEGGGYREYQKRRIAPTKMPSGRAAASFRLQAAGDFTKKHWSLFCRFFGAGRVPELTTKMRIRSDEKKGFANIRAVTSARRVLARFPRVALGGLGQAAIFVPLKRQCPRSGLDGLEFGNVLGHRCAQVGELARRNQHPVLQRTDGLVERCNGAAYATADGCDWRSQF